MTRASSVVNMYRAGTIMVQSVHVCPSGTVVVAVTVTGLLQKLNACKPVVNPVGSLLISILHS